MSAFKTFGDVAAWCVAATEEFGDPSEPVCQLFFRFVPDLEAFVDDAQLEDLMCGMLQDELVLVCGPSLPLFPMVVQIGPPAIDHDEIKAYGAQQIIPGVWAITPSLNVEGMIHGFVVVYGVPDRPPWEQAPAPAPRRLIVLPGEA